MAASPTVPERECVAMIAPSMSTTQIAASSRRAVDTGRSTSIAARGITATMFRARSLGFLNMPPTDPCTRPFSMRLTPRA